MSHETSRRFTVQFAVGFLVALLLACASTPDENVHCPTSPAGPRFGALQLGIPYDRALIDPFGLETQDGLVFTASSPVVGQLSGRVTSFDLHWDCSTTVRCASIRRSVKERLSVQGYDLVPTANRPNEWSYFGAGFRVESAEWTEEDRSDQTFSVWVRFEDDCVRLAAQHGAADARLTVFRSRATSAQRLETLNPWAHAGVVTGASGCTASGPAAERPS